MSQYSLSLNGINIFLYRYGYNTGTYRGTHIIILTPIMWSVVFYLYVEFENKLHSIVNEFNYETILLGTPNKI